jgi:hypothetical protein
MINCCCQKQHVEIHVEGDQLLSSSSYLLNYMFHMVLNEHVLEIEVFVYAFCIDVKQK